MAIDSDWIHEVVRQFEGPLTIYATRLLRGDVDRARDVVQDTFLKLWQADRDEVEGYLAKWLYTVCRNRAIDVGRKEQRMTRLDERPVEERGAPPDAAPPDCGAIIPLLEQLSDRQQEALRLKFQGGLSYKEIAEVMGTTANNVGVMLHTAIKNVRQKIAETAGPTPETESGHVPGHATG